MLLAGIYSDYPGILSKCNMHFLKTMQHSLPLWMLTRMLSAGETPDSSSQPVPSSAGTAASSAAEPQAQRPKPPLPRMDKAPELVAFEAGREVMDVLRAAHSHMCNVLEVISSDLGRAFSSLQMQIPHCFQSVCCLHAACELVKRDIC